MQGDGSQKKIGEIIRGETVGEMAIFTDENRFATVTAIRDCVLVKLEKTLFERVISEYPAVALNVTRLIIDRFKNIQNQKTSSHPVNICFLPLHKGMNINYYLQSMYNYIDKHSSIYFVDSEGSKTLLHETNIDVKNLSDSLESKRLIEELNNLEAKNDFMFYLCDEEPTEWNRKALRQADHIVLMGDANISSELTQNEKGFSEYANTLISLVLIHDENTIVPHNTIEWLEKRPYVNQNYHLRKNKTQDLKRLTRIISGKAIGIVFAGGGAKGFAHIGVLRALEEYNILVDYVGGTSIGSMIAAGACLDPSIDKFQAAIKSGAELNPSGDINYIPIVSLVKGINIKHMVKVTLENFCGTANIDLADAWKPIFIVATNYSNASEVVFRRGPMMKILLASAAIPGIFPPIIIDGDIYVDGGTFNNFPADIMSSFHVDKIIGIDFVIDKTYKLTIDEMPANYSLLKEKLFRRKIQKTRYLLWHQLL